MRPPCVNCPAQRVSAFDAEIRGATGCLFVRRSIPARTLIPSDWPDAFAFALVERGVLIRELGLASGEALAVDVVRPGGLLTLTPGEPAGYAASEAKACLLPRASLATLGRDAWRDVCRLQSAAQDRANRLALARAEPTAERKVGALLEALAADAPSRTVHAAIQQTDMAALLGIRRETVCRALAKLEATGQILRTEDGFAVANGDVAATTAAAATTATPGRAPLGRGGAR